MEIHEILSGKFNGRAWKVLCFLSVISHEAEFIQNVDF